MNAQVGLIFNQLEKGTSPHFSSLHWLHVSARSTFMSVVLTLNTASKTTPTCLNSFSQLSILRIAFYKWTHIALTAWHEDCIQTSFFFELGRVTQLCSVWKKWMLFFLSQCFLCFSCACWFKFHQIHIQIQLSFVWPFFFSV